MPADAVRLAAREQLWTGVHDVKSMLSGGVALTTDRVSSTQSSDDESLELFLEHGAFLVPTLVTYETLAWEWAGLDLPPASVVKVADVLDRATRAGVDVVVGTDRLGGMHRHQSEELAIRAGADRRAGAGLSHHDGGAAAAARGRDRRPAARGAA